MKIDYNLVGQKYFYEQKDKVEVSKLCFVLTNNRGDFLNLGVIDNSSKFQGLNFCDSNSIDMFKIIDNIVLSGMNVDSVEYGGYYVLRKMSSKFEESLVEVVNENNEVIEESIDFDNKVCSDRFYLGEKGGLIYDIFNYDGEVLIDLDMKKFHDFDDFGRIYNVEEVGDVILIEFRKENENSNEEYSLFLGIKATNFSYRLIGDWIEKNYEYSKRRGSLSNRYIYRAVGINVTDNKKIIFGYGLSRDDVFSQIKLLELHQVELEKFDSNIFSTFIKIGKFAKPLSQDVSVAYSLSNNSVYKFLNKDINVDDSVSGASFAGFPWFANVWARDELVGLRAFINNVDEKCFVKDKLFEYLNRVDVDSGALMRIDEKGSLPSPDGVYWLAKRFGDFMHSLDVKNKFSEVFSSSEALQIFDKFHLIFEKQIENFWNGDVELIKVKYGDSWMDTIEVNFPLDIQVQFLSFLEFVVDLGGRLNKDVSDMQEFVLMFRGRIHDAYFRDGYLYEEPFEDKISSNVFLAYYFCPDLFSSVDWERIFDNSLRHLKTSWGGISTLSHRDNRFKSEYTGENNLSYHHGDVWFWINNIAAICLNDLNEQKYREVVSKILISSTRDILKYGCIGFGSEISNAKNHEAHGCFAQLWSSSTYVELIDKIFERK